MTDDPYDPATRPPGGPGGNRIRFEREGDHEQSMFGGGAQDIERSIMQDTYFNSRMITKTISGVDTEKGDLGAAPLTKMTIRFTDGSWLQIVARSRDGFDLEVSDG